MARVALPGLLVVLLLAAPGLAAPLLGMGDQASTAPGTPDTSGAVAVVDPAPARLVPAHDLPGPDPLPVSQVVRDLMDNRTAPLAENVTGEEIDREEVDVELHLNVTNAELDVPGIVFGGGKVQMDVDAHARVDFRAIRIARMEQALKEVAGMPSPDLARQFGANSSAYVVTAEEVRRLGGRAALEAFQQAEAEALAAYVEESLPGMAVLTSRMAWSNVEPHTPDGRDAGRVAEGERPALRVRDPPLVLEASFRLQYLDRQSLGDLLWGPGQGGAEGGDGDEGGGGGADAPAASRASQVLQAQTLPAWERSAFELLGIDQVLEAAVPPGWRVHVTVEVPKGFTIESATNDLLVAADRRTATFVLDGASADGPLTSANVLTMSSRFLAVSLLLVVVLTAGFALRVLVEPATRLLARRRGSRGPALPPSLAAPPPHAPRAAPRRPARSAAPRSSLDAGARAALPAGKPRERARSHSRARATLLRRS